MKRKNYQSIACNLDIIARANKNKSQAEIKQGWIDAAQARLVCIMDGAPHGSGIDRGIRLDDYSTPQKLVFNLSFHHMNENGMYDGWTEHRAIVTPDLQFNYNLKITGPDRNQIKDYLHEVISYWLDSEISD